MKKFCCLILLFVFSLIFAPANFAAGKIDPSFSASITEGLGSVEHTLTQPDGKIIAFGTFQKANGGRFNNIVRFNADGTLDTTFNGTGSGANGYISVAALQTDGKIIIGGNFTAFNGQAINRLARLNADGSLDQTFAPTANFNNAITDIVIQPDGKILVCGRFAGGIQALSSGIARFNTDGSIDATFQNNLGTNRAVLTIALLTDGKVLIGGEFSEIGASSQPFIARLNTNGTLDNSFSSSLGDTVNKILIQPDGKLLVAGSLLTRGVTRLNADGSQALTASRTERPSVFVEAGYDIALQSDGKVLVAYGVGPSGSVTQYYVIRLNADLTFDSTFSSSIPDRFPITDINLFSNGKFIISGNFVQLNLSTKRYLAQMLPDGTLDPDFQPSVSSVSRVSAVKRQPDGKILVGGLFEFVNGVRRTNIVRLNTDGSLDNTFNPSTALFDYIANSVFDIELQSNGKILVGRYRFSGGSLALSESDGGLSEGSIIRLNTDGTLDSSFGTMVTHFVQGIAVSSDNKIFIGGYLENLQVQPFGVEGFRKLMPNGSIDTVFNILQQPQTGSVSEILIQPDGKALIGGTFATVGGEFRPGTARYDEDGKLDITYMGAVSGVRAIGLASDGKIYAGGSFGMNGSNPNTNIARLKTDGSIDPTFVGTANATVRDLLVQPDGKIVIGGDFTSYYSNTVGRVARVNTNGSFDPSFNTGAGASGSVYALERQPDGKTLVGGQFLDFNGAEKLSLVRLQESNAIAPFDFDGDSKTDISIFRPSNGEWWYLRSSDEQNRAFQFGNSSDKLAPADFTGDGKTDIAIWRPSTGEWFVLRSEDSSFYAFPFGTNGDIPAPADFDGDNKADAAVFRPSTATWYIPLSAGGTTIQQFGQAGDAPVVGDYDGDGRADIAIYRVAQGEWWIQRSTAGTIVYQFGNSSDKPVQGDYTGDGKSDVAFWRPSTGEWFILRSENQSYYAFPFGAAGDKPTPGDYDGDGKADAAIFRPSDTNWYLLRSTSGFTAIHFGFSTDKPVPEAFVP